MKEQNETEEKAENSPFEYFFLFRSVNGLSMV